MEKQIPVLKQDSTVNLEVDYKQCAALVQSLFIIIRSWTEARKKEFAEILKENKSTNDPDYITYLILNGMYNKIMKQAQEEGKVEMTELTTTLPLEPKS